MLVASQLGFVSAVFTDSRDAWAVITGGTLIFLVGVVDDIWGLDALTKAAGQIIAAGVMVLQGVQLLWLPFNGVTVLDLQHQRHADRAARRRHGQRDQLRRRARRPGRRHHRHRVAGVLRLRLPALGGPRHRRATTAALLSTVLAGICAGFLPHNFNPARIFMGDSGSMLAGLLLSAIVITLTGKIDPYAVGDATLLPALMPLLLPFAVLAVPSRRPAPGGGAAHPCRTVAVRAGQAAPAPPTAGDRPLASGRRCSSCTCGPAPWPLGAAVAALVRVRAGLARRRRDGRPRDARDAQPAKGPA